MIMETFFLMERKRPMRMLSFRDHGTIAQLYGPGVFSCCRMGALAGPRVPGEGAHTARLAAHRPPRHSRSYQALELTRPGLDRALLMGPGNPGQKPPGARTADQLCGCQSGRPSRRAATAEIGGSRDSPPECPAPPALRS